MSPLNRINLMQNYIQLIYHKLLSFKPLNIPFTFLGSFMIQDGGITMDAWMPSVHCSLICCIIKHDILLWYAALHQEQLMAIIS